MELNPKEGTVRLQKDKISDLKAGLWVWQKKKHLQKWKFLRLFNHACKAVRAGWSFLRRLIDESTMAKQLEHYVTKQGDEVWYWMVAPICGDVEWGADAVLIKLPNSNSHDNIGCAGSWGCGTYCEMEQFQLRWNDYLRYSHVSVKELTRNCDCSSNMGQEMVWSIIADKIQCTPVAMVAIVNSGMSHNSKAMHLMWCLAFIAAKFQLSLSAVYLPGKGLCLDCTSNQWTKLWNDIFPQV